MTVIAFFFFFFFSAFQARKGSNEISQDDSGISMNFSSSKKDKNMAETVLDDRPRKRQRRD